MKVGYLKGARQAILPPVQQVDAVLSQTNPVSNTLYTVLDTTRNVKIEAITAKITWAVTQPTPLEVVVTIDGIPTTFLFTNPANAQAYGACEEVSYNILANATQPLISAFTAAFVPFKCHRRSVKVQARITWAVTQPTPLLCRVKWGKW